MSEADDPRTVILNLVWQFGYRGRGGTLGTGGLSALEVAFDYLGWTDPHFDETIICQDPDCDEPHTCGTPTPDGYRHLCYDHCVGVTKEPSCDD